MENEHKTFQVTSIESVGRSNKKWWQFTEMSRKELGQTAVIGFLAGGILSTNTALLVQAFGGLGFLFGYVFGALLAAMGSAAALLWLYKVIRRQK